VTHMQHRFGISEPDRGRFPIRTEKPRTIVSSCRKPVSHWGQIHGSLQVRPCCGSAGRKPKVMELVGKLGFEAVDAGPLKNARLLEPLAMLWIDQAMNRGRGRDFAFALVNMR
jgi:hypothetical protein